ncbi:hypothetical protein PSHT_02703 [Puccinia striiformis]|uniref:Uncharacterized protein n=1 Tax=Puccinia striiformis TaxID=27350 RepID=A0A2S4WHF3_9BASI|nr:hypothetical protein PSHT_02703 [Puccinia striiformis]
MIPICSTAKPETTSLYKQLRIVGRSHPAGIVVYTSYPTSRALCVSASDILQVTGSTQVDNGVLHPDRLPPVSQQLQPCSLRRSPTWVLPAPSSSARRSVLGRRPQTCSVKRPGAHVR